MGLFLGALPHLHDDPWDYDEGVLLQAAALSREGHALYAQVPLNKPPALALWLRLVFALADPTIPAARVSMALLAVFGALALGAYTEAVFGAGASVVAVALWCLVAEVPVRASAVMPDLPAVALVLAALYAQERGRRSPRWRLAALAGGLFALAVGCQLAVLTALPVFLATALGGRAPPPRRWGHLAASALGALAVALALFLPHELGGLWRWVVRYNLAGRGTALTESSPGLVLGMLWLHRWLVLLGLVGAALAWRDGSRRGAVARCGLWWVTVVAALCRWSPLWPNYLLLLLVPLFPLAGFAVGEVVRARTISRGVPLAVVTALSIALLVQRSGQWIPWPGRSFEGERLRRELVARVPPGARVVTDAPFEVFAAGRRVPPALADTSFKRVSVGWLTTAQVLSELQRPDARWALLATGRLRALPGLEPWLTAHAVGRWRHGEATLYALGEPSSGSRERRWSHSSGRTSVSSRAMH